MTSRRFEGQVVLVTGGSRGIGAAVCRRFAREGARVVVNYLTAADRAARVVEEIVADGGEAVAWQADVAEEADVRALLRGTVRHFGRLDHLVANAGVTRDDLLATMTADAWDAVVRTNLRGPFLCAREALPFLIGQGTGSIVCLTSVAADRATRGHANYAAAKAGLNALVRSLAVEVARKLIRVNAVAPGVVDTEMSDRVRNLAEAEILGRIPLRRIGRPDDVAGAVCFLASEDAAYITGEVLHVTGGMEL